MPETPTNALPMTALEASIRLGNEVARLSRLCRMRLDPVERAAVRRQVTNASTSLVWMLHRLLDAEMADAVDAVIQETEAGG